MTFNCIYSLKIVPNLLLLIADAWKAPINLTPESHERVKRSLQEPQPPTNVKKMRTLPPMETIPNEVICNQMPDPENAPVIMLSQVDNNNGLNRAIE